MIQISSLELASPEKQQRLQDYARQFDSFQQALPEWDRTENFTCCTEVCTMPKVSVIIPVYNVEKYLFHCLSSILHQSLREIEIICVDDCSTDSCPQMLDFFALLDARVKVIRHEKNSRLGIARNTGMANAHGEYLYFIDSDDWCDTTLLAKAYANARQYDSDFVLLPLGHVDTQTGRMGQCHIPHAPCARMPFSRKDFPAGKFSFDFFIPSTCTKLYRHDFIKRENLKFPDFRFIEDLAFHAVALSAAERISFLDSPVLYFYRINRTGNLSNAIQKNIQCSLTMMKVLQLIWTELEKRGLEEELSPAFEDKFKMTMRWEIHNLCRGEDFHVFYDEFRNHFLPALHWESGKKFHSLALSELIRNVEKYPDGFDFLLFYFQEHLTKEKTSLQKKLRKFLIRFIPSGAVRRDLRRKYDL